MGLKIRGMPLLPVVEVRLLEEAVLRDLDRDVDGDLGFGHGVERVAPHHGYRGRRLEVESDLRREV